MAVEDYPGVLDFLGSLLSFYSYEHTLYSCPSEAYEGIVRDCPDMVITDNRMESNEKAGEDLFRRVHEQFSGEIPVIIHSNYKHLGETHKLMHEGLYSFLEKCDSRADSFNLIDLIEEHRKRILGTSYYTDEHNVVVVRSRDGLDVEEEGRENKQGDMNLFSVSFGGENIVEYLLNPRFNIGVVLFEPATREEVECARDLATQLHRYSPYLQMVVDLKGVEGGVGEGSFPLYVRRGLGVGEGVLRSTFDERKKRIERDVQEGDPQIWSLVGPGASGKTTLIRELQRMFPYVHHVVSDTTRRPRPGEGNGVEHYFVDENSMADRREGFLFSFQSKQRNWYAIRNDELLQPLQNGREVFASIKTIDYFFRMAQLYPRMKRVLLLPSAERVERYHRKREGSVEHTLSTARAELSQYLDLGERFSFDLVFDDDAIENGSCQIAGEIGAVLQRERFGRG